MIRNRSAVPAAKAGERVPILSVQVNLFVLDVDVITSLEAAGILHGDGAAARCESDCDCGCKHSFEPCPLTGIGSNSDRRTRGTAQVAYKSAFVGSAPHPDCRSWNQVRWVRKGSLQRPRIIQRAVSGRRCIG